MESGAFCEGLQPDDDDAAMLLAAPNHPVFRIDAA
jgi:hypothetical protein